MPGKQHHVSRTERLCTQTEEFGRKEFDFIADSAFDLLRQSPERGWSQAGMEIQEAKLKQARQELADLKRELEDLYECAPCGYVTLDSTGVVSRINLTGVLLLGTSRKLLLQTRFSRLIAPGHGYAFAAALKKAAQTGIKQRVDLSLNRGDSLPCWVQAEVQAEWSENRDLKQWRVALLDITEKKELEAALSRSGHQAPGDKPADPSGYAPGATQEGPAPGRPLRILVAEDSKIDQIYILDLLKTLGHCPVLAETGREALKAIAHDRFDGVLMDIRMPEMDGDEATLAIRTEPPEGVDPDIPIVALTAYTLIEERDNYLHSGFSAYLTKPINTDELNRTLEKLF